MAIISFTKTVNEFKSGKKTVTRRDWSQRYFLMWQKWWMDGKRVHTAYDKNPRSGGKQIGRFELTMLPYHEKLKDMPVEDLLAEGGMCETRPDFYKLIGKTEDDIVTVIRFEKL